MYFILKCELIVRSTQHIRENYLIYVACWIRIMHLWIELNVLKISHLAFGFGLFGDQKQNRVRIVSFQTKVIYFIIIIIITNFSSLKYKVVINDY